MYADANRPEQTGRVLERYLRREPGDWKAWMDMATVQLQMKRPAEAVQAVQKAVQIGGMQAMSLISEDPRLAPLLRAGMPAPGSLINLPGIMPNKQP
jgi:hypothetical protein